ASRICMRATCDISALRIDPKRGQSVERINEVEGAFDELDSSASDPVRGGDDARAYDPLLRALRIESMIARASPAWRRAKIATFAPQAHEHYFHVRSAEANAWSPTQQRHSPSRSTRSSGAPKSIGMPSMSGSRCAMPLWQSMHVYSSPASATEWT